MQSMGPFWKNEKQRETFVDLTKRMKMFIPGYVLSHGFFEFLRREKKRGTGWSITIRPRLLPQPHMWKIYRIVLDDRAKMT